MVYLKFGWSVFHPPSYPGGDQEAGPEEWGPEGEHVMSKLKAWPSYGCPTPTPTPLPSTMLGSAGPGPSPQAATGMEWAGDGRARSEEWQCGNEQERRGARSLFPARGPPPAPFLPSPARLPASPCPRVSPAPQLTPQAAALSQRLC